MKTANQFPEDPYDKYRRPWPNSPYEPNPHNPADRKHPDWKAPAPRAITIADVFPRLDRLSIGWSPLLDSLREVTNAKPAYPPYDIVKLNDVTNVLQVAVAGFAKSEIKVVIQEAVLTISGKKATKPEGEIIYQGIAARDFELKLAVAEYWSVDSAEVVDGMLLVTFTKELPEEKKPKVIDIK
jgi:molecular chaperone IbpA